MYDKKSKFIMNNYSYKVEVLTPVNIGTGQKIMNFELASTNRGVYVLNIQKIAEENIDIINKINDLLLNDDNATFAIQRLLENKKLRVAKYSKYSLKNYNIKELHRLRNIIEFVKTAGYPFIPGSSIKGVVMKELISTNSLFEQVRDIMRQIASDKDETKSKKFKLETEKLFRKILGDPKHSFGRFIRFSDTNPVSPDNLHVASVKIMAINEEQQLKYKKEDYKYKKGDYKYKRGDYSNSPEEALDIFYEVLPPGVTLEGTFSLLSNEYLNRLSSFSQDYDEFSWIKSKSALFQLFNGDLLMNIIKKIKNNVKEYIEKEKQIFSKVSGGSKYLKFLLDIEKKNNQLGDGEILIRLGSSTGFLSKSIIKNPKEVVDLLRNFMRGKVYNYEFPKTRKVIIKENGDFEQLGWVKISFLQQRRETVY
ncbi:MAG: type III-A CRISPR-associated RAMP protein Csm5 [Fervidobacterium sp.]|nr:type III-A CRISPR-associated RAMP protein Csm5 [Fervidobacterium sp.]